MGDGYELERKAKELLQAAQDWYRLHENSNTPRDTYISQSVLEKIERVLTSIDGKLSSPYEITSLAGGESSPALSVIQGGVQSQQPP